MYNGYKRYNKCVKPPSVLLSYLLFMRYACKAGYTRRNSWGGVRKGCTLVLVPVPLAYLLQLNHARGALGVKW